MAHWKPEEHASFTHDALRHGPATTLLRDRAIRPATCSSAAKPLTQRCVPHRRRCLREEADLAAADAG